MADQGETAGDRRKQEMFEKRGALSRTFMRGFRLGLLRKDSRTGVFQKVDAALITLPPVWLFVVTGRTLERQRRVTPRAEASAVGSIGGTLRALHNSNSREWFAAARFPRL